MLRVRVRPEVVVQLNQIADRIGVPRSTVAAYAIGEYAARMSNQLGLQDRLMDFLTGFGAEALSQSGLGTDPDDSPDD
jgi:predicted transcriptional regulator